MRGNNNFHSFLTNKDTYRNGGSREAGYVHYQVLLLSFPIPWPLALTCDHFFSTMWAFYGNLWAKGDHLMETFYLKAHRFGNRYPEWMPL